MSTRVKIFGERNCGTNYLYQLIAANTDSELLYGTVPHYFQKFPELWKNWYFSMRKRSTLGWKHSTPDVTLIQKACSLDQDIRVVTLIKNPYTFLLSLYKRPYGVYHKKPESFEEFLVRAIISPKREGLSALQKPNPVQLWNIKTAVYLGLRKLQGKTYFMTYEDLIINPEREFNKLSHHLGLSQIGEFQNIQRGTKTDSDKTFEYYQDYYLNERWRKDLTRESIELINRSLNGKVVEEAGYSIITEISTEQ